MASSTRNCGNTDIYAQELFQQQELIGYMKDMLLNAKKSVFEHVVYDSQLSSAPSPSSLRSTKESRFTRSCPSGSRFRPPWVTIIPTGQW